MAADNGKAFERRHAKRFYNGKRLPKDGGSHPDGETTWETWDCKDRKKIAVISWFKYAESLYSTYTGDRRFHLALHIPGEKTDYVMLKADDYQELVRKEGRLGLLEELGYKQGWSPE